jgi:hypothetical protein
MGRVGCAEYRISQEYSQFLFRDRTAVYVVQVQPSS